jgi:hypothetical protein
MGVCVWDGWIGDWGILKGDRQGEGRRGRGGGEEGRGRTRREVVVLARGGSGGHSPREYPARPSPTGMLSKPSVW